MGRSAIKLTKRVADKSQDVDGVTLWDTVQLGLGLRCYATGRRTWVYRFRWQGRQRTSTLGVYRDASGSDVVLSIGAARQLAGEWRVALDSGRDPRVQQAAPREGARETIADLWEAFIDHKRRREGLSAKTLSGYERLYRPHVANPRYGIAGRPVEGIKRRDILDLRDAVADQARARARAAYEAAVDNGGDPVRLAAMERRLPTAGNGAANRLIALLSSVFTWLLDRELVESSPCARIKRLPTAGRDPDSVLTRADALDAIDLIRRWKGNDGHRDALLLLIFTAGRTAEVRDRDWTDVILDDPDRPLPHLRVEHHKGRRRTRAAKRIPLIPDALAVVLARWPGSELEATRGPDGWEVRRGRKRWPMIPSAAWADQLPPASGPMFPGKDPSKPLTDVYHPWQEISSASERPRVRAIDVHGLRAVAATLLRSSGVERDAIAQLLGHAPDSPVTDRYLFETWDTAARLGDVLAAT